MNQPMSVSELLSFLTAGSPHAFTPNDFPGWWTRICRWPPNVFAITATLLNESGLYRVEFCYNDEGLDSVLAEWLKALEPVSLADHCCTGDVTLPPRLLALGETLRSALASPVQAELSPAIPAARKALLTLHSLADEACKRLDTLDCFMTTKKLPGEIMREDLRKAALARLDRLGTLSCFDRTRIRILPKKHTPQVGMTLRSLSLHLAAVRGEAQITWKSELALPDGCSCFTRKHHALNLLLIPWPFQLDSSSFQESEKEFREGVCQFDYEPRGIGSVRFLEHVQGLISSLVERRTQVHGVVLPEVALTEAEFNGLVNAIDGEACTRGAFVLSGVRTPGNAGSLPLNEAWFSGRSRQLRKQQKHHKWRLDRRQLTQYHLGASLPPEGGGGYWERMAVGPRTLNFVTWLPGLTLCHLVCEDLARVEPVAEVVRAVGPNLVIGLLLDGPQLEKRWSGRYASIFADDPGSSVLTLTSLGMVKRSLGREDKPSTTVALWKDQIDGTRELSIPDGAQALLLSLFTNRPEERTYDGRHDVGGVLTFSSVEPISSRR